MPTVYFGTKNEPGFELKESNDMIAVRTRSRRSMMRSAGTVPMPLSAELEDGVLVAAYPDAGVEVYRVPVGRGGRSVDQRKRALRTSPDVRFAGRVVMDPVTEEPVIYTENLIIKFVDRLDPEQCQAVLREAGLTIKQELSYATNAYFASVPEGSGQVVFDIAASVLGLGLSKYPDARAMIDEGLAMVLATDFNPGSSPTTSMPLVLSLARTQMKMTAAEAISSATINAAFSLDRGHDRGTLEPGKRADFSIWDVEDYRDIGYWLGKMPAKVFICGAQI